MEDCVYMIQAAPPGLETATPLVLIHDGGGTTVSYCSLNSLDRVVYGIQNPQLYSGEPWEHGLPEMARVYADLILSVVPSGRLLLGGWSLGGILSLEVANILLRTSSLSIVGMVMVDSIYPLAVFEEKANIVGSQPVFSNDTQPETRKLVSQCMKLAQPMAYNWIPPIWRGCTDSGLALRRTELEQKLLLIEPTLSRNAGNHKHNLPSIPQTILLRCDDYVPVSRPDMPDAVSRVDVVREFPALGWEKYPNDFTPVILSIPGHHFNIFTDDHSNQTGMQNARTLERVMDQGGLRHGPTLLERIGRLSV
ncbi:uncharacterized protein PADG_08042 [Paracoccidioides brasiliensis Pb18]|uniref:Thioesterase domain-containing protein n=1 Tax=Paracoccidioides brasiliensis (strain Pb18) TaxID=502780 RepID=C1GL35_PARBD|nr:uncharacterized protein PADG_08042 [Paracoccidioides brasiliensis Pb18]EEH43222.2 hypothetical protein PADG_08042 [Paracoccidioides brasiliensis Pb18]